MSITQSIIEDKDYYLGKLSTGYGVDHPMRFFKRSEGDTLKSILLDKYLQNTGWFRRWWIKLGHPRYIGEIWARGHSGYIDYYLFWCCECNSFQVDYVHGTHALYCQACRARSDR